LIGFTVITIPIISGAPPICSATVLPDRWQCWHQFGDRYRQSRNLLKLLVGPGGIHYQTRSRIYRVPPLPNVPLYSKAYFRDCPTVFCDAGSRKKAARAQAIARKFFVARLLDESFDDRLACPLHRRRDFAG
jgi:hypothetical protein